MSLMDYRYYDDGEGMILEGRIEEINPETGVLETVADFTGTNSVWFPEIFTALTVEQQEWVLRRIGPELLYILAGYDV